MGYPWESMGRHGSSCTRRSSCAKRTMCSHGFPWVPHGFPWVRKGSQGFPEVPRGTPWFPMGSYGFLHVFYMVLLVFYQILWIFMKFSEILGSGGANRSELMFFFIPDSFFTVPDPKKLEKTKQSSWGPPGGPIGPMGPVESPILKKLWLELD